MPSYSDKSRARLATCHPDLQALFFEVIKHRDCTILCGHRGEAEQNQAYADGKSKARWPESKHNATPSLAVDAAPWPLVWHDKQSFIEFGNFVEGLAAGMGIKIRWGGRFQSFFDGPHFELVNP
jgi:hypothetical protein